MISTDWLKSIFHKPIVLNRNIIEFESDLVVDALNQGQTQDIFSDKWTDAEDYDGLNNFYEFQFEWFLSLYGFDSEADFKNYLSTKNTIIDTGCGLGYKAAWLAKLAPHALVLGVDISDSIGVAARNFNDQSNLFFFKGDIADTGLKDGVIDFTLCDQVIMHTEVPENTFKHLAAITSDQGEFGCYVYSKKALPRELIDDHFRKETHNISRDEMWKFSEQLTTLGKNLSDLKVEFECPDIPVLGIKGGKYDIQRFIYWNFLKCFWRDDWGFEMSKSTNFDWYAPSNAKRFSKEEFLEMASDANMRATYLHEEEACYSGRFAKKGL